MSNPMITPISTGATALSATQMAGRRPRTDPTKLMAPVADLLGMKPDELKQALAGGKTLNQLATDKGVSHEDLIAAIKKGLESARPTKAAATRTSGAVSDPDGDGDDDAGKMAEKIAAGQGPGGARRAEGAGAGAPPNSQLLDDVASMLKMSSTDLTTALTKGTSLADLAKQQDVSPDSLLQAVGRGMVLKTYA